jgi:hypothetical protein
MKKEQWWNDDYQGKIKETRRRTCSSNISIHQEYQMKSLGIELEASWLEGRVKLAEIHKIFLGIDEVTTRN